jgi:hypothetical protein
MHEAANHLTIGPEPAFLSVGRPGSTGSFEAPMRRRKALQIAAAAAALPWTGCGATSPEPATGQTGTKATGAGKDTAPGLAAQPSATATSADIAPPEPTTKTNPEPAPEPAPKPPEPSFARVICRVGKNHGHVFAVTLADVTAGVEKTYQIAGTSTHPHAVTLTVEDMKTLLKGELLRTTSTQGLTHVHRVHVRCAPAEDPPAWISAVSASFTGKDEHEAIITAADMAAGTDKTYDVQGLAGHSHSLTLTAAHFEKLKKEGAISIQTSRLEEDAHMHVVIIRYTAPKRG